MDDPPRATQPFAPSVLLPLGGCKICVYTDSSLYIYRERQYVFKFEERERNENIESDESHSCPKGGNI